jgi:hypothetical protein
MYHEVYASLIGCNLKFNLRHHGQAGKGTIDFAALIRDVKHINDLRLLREANRLAMTRMGKILNTKQIRQVKKL